MKQSESLAEPLFKGRLIGKSIYNTKKVCRRCQLQYPKSCTHCEECGKPLASKPRA